MRFYRWDQQTDSSTTNSICWELAEVLIPRLSDCASSAAFAVLVHDRNIVGICDWSLSYRDLSVADAAIIRQVQAFFQKRSDIDLGIDRRKAAIETYLSAERLCFETNSLFRMRDSGHFCFDSSVDQVIHLARRKISHILGDCPKLEELKYRFGPGATTTLQRRMASPRAKLSDVPSCSEALYPLLETLEAEMPHFLRDEEGGSRLACVMPAKLDFVPKTAKTDRSIAVEPSLNQMVQLGIGEVIARRLCRFGIDIRDQAPNQRMAREGSISGALATLDLSSASDTLATRLIFELLPLDWFNLLDSARSAFIRYGDYTFYQEKFCSMGNGFTFPLETLIFYALTLAAGDLPLGCESVHVYGDDVIVPVEHFASLCSSLHALGCLVNEKKSFSSGPFRESCGHDYYSGINIRPLYFKGPLHGFDAFRAHNFFYESGDVELCNTILRFVDPSLRLYGPPGYGCGHLIGGPSLKPKGRKKGWSGYSFETYTFKPRMDFSVRRFDRVLPLYTTYIRENAPSGVELSADGFIVTEPLMAPHNGDGILGTQVPGTKGYNRISIYTLTDYNP